MSSLDYSKLILSVFPIRCLVTPNIGKIVFASWESQLWVQEPRWPLYIIFPQCLARTSAQDLLHRRTNNSVSIGLYRLLETKWRKGIAPALVPLFCTRQHLVQRRKNWEKNGVWNLAFLLPPCVTFLFTFFHYLYPKYMNNTVNPIRVLLWTLSETMYWV